MASNVQRASISIPEFAQRYKKFLKELTIKDYSHRTVVTYSSHLGATCLYFGKLPEYLNADDIRDYLHHLIVKNPSSSRSMFEHTVAALRCYYKTFGYTTPYMALPSIPKRKKLPVVLSYDEMLSLLKVSKTVRSKAILGMLYSCGLRVSEVCNMEIRDVNSGRMLVHIRQSKGNKDRYVPLAENMLPVLRAYYKKHKPQQYLFNAHGLSGKKMHPSEVSHILGTARILSGMTRQITCHTLRHTFASHLLEMGVDIFKVQRLLGHANIQTTLVYLHVVFPDAENGKYFSPLDVLLSPKEKK